MQVALVNTNRITPPIAPIGLDYVAEALHQAGHHVTVLDLCWADEWDSAIVDFFDKKDFDPAFFLEPAVAPFVSELLEELIDNDEHFFFFDPSGPERDYNYSANRRLIEAIENGYRGAYWDVLRKYQPT